MKQFTLPQNAKTYVNNVKDRSFALITHNIWNGVKSIDLKRWFKNFEGDLEEYFAACILDALIFRSEDQLVAQARELFTKKICLELVKVGFNLKDYNDLSKILKGNIDNRLRIVSVANKGERPVKSANLILRIYKRKLGFNDSWFITPDEVKKDKLNGVRTFIFIDDFLGTGSQFCSMYKSLGFSLLLNDCNSIYAPLVAHNQGCNMIREKYNKVVVTASEFIDDDYNVFNYAFEDGTNNSKGARDFYLYLLKKNEFINIPENNQFGFGNLGLAYTFSHSSPDNCLHIIWDNQNGWHPLVAK